MIAWGGEGAEVTKRNLGINTPILEYGFRGLGFRPANSEEGTMATDHCLVGPISIKNYNIQQGLYSKPARWHIQVEGVRSSRSSLGL